MGEWPRPLGHSAFAMPKAACQREAYPTADAGDGHRGKCGLPKAQDNQQ